MSILTAAFFTIMMVWFNNSDSRILLLVTRQEWTVMNSNEAVTLFIHDNVNNTKTKYLEEWTRFTKKYLHSKWESVNFLNDENIFWKTLFRNVFLELSKMVFTILITALCFSVDFNAKKIKSYNISLIFESEHACKSYGFLTHQKSLI